MMFPLVVALLQVPAPLPPPLVTADDGQPASRDARPVRVWLGTTGSLVRGQPVPVVVQAAHDGDLTVLHRRTAGRLEVMFPSNPTADPLVRLASCQLRCAATRPA